MNMNERQGAAVKVNRLVLIDNFQAALLAETKINAEKDYCLSLSSVLRSL